MSYKNTKTYVTRMIQISMSADQSISASTATLLDFDTIAGDTGHGVSLVSGGNGRIRLSANNHYYCVGFAALDKDTNTDTYRVKVYNTSGTQLTESDGAFQSFASFVSGVDKHYQCMNFQLLVSPTSNTDYDFKTDGETGTMLADGTSIFIIEMSDT